MQNALAGLTILEIAGGVATRYCGHLFAIHGATVLQVGVPDNTGVGYGGAATAAYASWLDAGKQRLGDDLSAALRGAGQTVDLVIAGQEAATVAAVDAALDQAKAKAVRLGLTWFAVDGPYRDWVGTDAVIQAMSAVAYATGPKDGTPMLPRGHAPQVIGGATAFIAGLGALLGRDAGWRGHRIDTNILEANMCLSESGAASAALTSDRTVRRGVNRFTPTFPGGIYQAADGWIGVTALTPSQWLSLCDLVGLPDLAQDPVNLVSLQRMERADQFDQRLVPAFKTKSAQYWLEEGQRRRIPFAPVPDLAELPRTPHWQERRSFTDLPGIAGATAPAMPFHAEALPPVVSNDRGADKPAMPLPLSGLRVLDFSMGWAGPLAARHFADLGADVVKVESCTHFDWWRGFDGPIEGDPPPYETRPAFLMVNRNKRGITLDLKTEAGKALVRKLAARSDVMIENYAPGVLDKLGIGAKALVAESPGMVALSMGAFGAKGPWRSFRAYGSTVEQASGLPFVNGEAEDPPTMQHVAYGDPIAGLYGVIACLLPLYSRNRRNAGAIIDLGQVECLFQLCADAIVAQSVQSAPLLRQGSRHPTSALRAVIGTATAHQWFAIAVETPRQWNALAGVIDRADLAMAVTASLADLKAREAEMEQAVLIWAKPRSLSNAVAALQTAGISAGPVYAAVDLLDDPQLVQAGFWRRADRAFIGKHVVPHTPYQLDGVRPPLHTAAPTLGQHNHDVLAGDLGLSASEIDKLHADGIIGTRAVAATAD